MTVPSTERVSLGEAAYQRLRADIVSCRLAPGQRLTERSLAESSGFGISSIRDALTRLDHEGLVQTLPRKGYRVTPLTLKSVDDLFTLWRIVGPEIARLGVKEATAEQRQQIIAAFAAAHGPPTADNTADPDHALRRVEQAGAAFSLLAAATDNDYLINIYQRLQNDIGRVWALLSQTDVSMPDPTIDAQWVEFLERRDSDAAAAHARAHIAESHARVLRILSRWPSVVASEITSLRG